MKEDNMKQYIDKDTLVAEIKKRLEPVEKRLLKNNSYNLSGEIAWARDKALYDSYKFFLSFVNTLEVKEEDLLTEKKTEKELAESYINIFDKKFGDKLPNLKGKQLAEFKNLINTCEQTFYMKYFDYHATQGKLFEKLALLWAAWGKEHLSLEVKEVDLNEEINNWYNTVGVPVTTDALKETAKHFFELGINTQKKDKDESIQRI